jgi:UDP-GlcNAc:undecaprenyl-phosphate GlcNAc-1-phosphate transferase
LYVTGSGSLGLLAHNRGREVSIMQALIFRHVYAFIFSFLFTLYMVPLMRKAAYSLGLLDRPDGQIKNHKKEVPYLGGVAIFVPFIATLALVYPFENHLLWFLLGCTLLLFIGLVDDMRVFEPGQKFLGQVVAVLCFLKGGFSLHAFFFSNYFSIAASGFWMLSIINAFNLVDVMDGLSSLLALIASGTFFCIALMLCQYKLSLLMLPFMGSLFAFFLYNKPPAKIYLGDAGSMFIGGFLAATPLLISWSTMNIEGYFAPLIILSVPLLILGVPAFEICTLIVIRTFKGIPFYKGSPHHFSIYLRRRKWSERKVLLFSGFFGIALSGVALLFLRQFLGIITVALLLSFFYLLWLYFVFYRT